MVVAYLIYFHSNFNFSIKYINTQNHNSFIGQQLNFQLNKNGINSQIKTKKEDSKNF